MDSKVVLARWATISALLLQTAQAGPVAYAACQSACATGTVATTAGTAGVFAPVAAASYAACQSACAASFLAPEPWGCTVL